jgi:hypothetical protein
MTCIPSFVQSGTGIQIIIIRRRRIIRRRVLPPTPTGAEAKKTWLYTSTPPYVFIA